MKSCQFLPHSSWQTLYPFLTIFFRKMTTVDDPKRWLEKFRPCKLILSLSPLFFFFLTNSFNLVTLKFTKGGLNPFPTSSPPPSKNFSNPLEWLNAPSRSSPAMIHQRVPWATGGGTRSNRGIKFRGRRPIDCGRGVDSIPVNR